MKANLENRTVAKPVHNEEYIVPQVDVFESVDGYVLTVEMPGVGKEGLEITLEGNEISIVGRPTEETADREVLFRERRHQNYGRVFELDPAIDTGRISARMDQGVLTLTLPKSEQAKPRKITVE